MALVLGAIFFFGGPQVVKMIQNRTVVGPNEKPDAAGVVRTNPNTLLAETNALLAGKGLPALTMNEYALARALRSEHGSSSATIRTWVAWAIKNSVKAGSNVFEKLTKSASMTSSGLFATQISDLRYASTAQGPTMDDIEIARNVLRSGIQSDPTRGATNFFSPRLQDSLYAKAQAGVAQYASIKKDAAGIIAKWVSGGLSVRGAPSDAMPGEVIFLGPARMA